MTKTSQQQTGQRGEDIALNYLNQQGFTLVKRNFRYRRAEVDLIVQKDKLLVFVEVKTRHDTSFGFPETFVKPEQTELIVAAADHYVQENNWEGMIRFDIVAITLLPDLEIEHFEDAFY
ncbi:YraN family protein [Tunicatimonas pelagia]|uniref:YraN family protein n=1 Tax=Tunicatimonas pelagia TaxID=931531 RepID=UPI002666BC4B|nr:YraN family protein [Tunicatimonas pelagia]WKN44521.1 YraN family protein [Tunicatimonas pelagia]